MSRTADHSLELPPDVQALYAPVADALAEVEAVFRREMRSSDVLIDELARYGVLLGGKRLRPALVLLSGQAAGKLTDRHLVLGAVMEMIHTATLIHDDVLDEADVRRHLATINARWGEQASVLLGDLLFTRAFQLACTLDDMWVCRTVGQSTNLVCEGELRQVGNSGNLLLGESEYLRIIEAKTAELCACCCRVGARFAGADEQT